MHANTTLALSSSKTKALLLLALVVGGVVVVMTLSTSHSAAARVINEPAPGAPASLFSEQPTAHHVQIADGASWSVSTYPITDGKFCAGMKLPEQASFVQLAACRPNGLMFADNPLIAHFGARQQGDPQTWAEMWVWGIASPSVSQVKLQLTDCSVVDLPLDSGGVFLYLDPRSSIAQGLAPQELRAYSADGSEVYSKSVLMSAPTEADGSPRPGASVPQPTSCG